MLCADKPDVFFAVAEIVSAVPSAGGGPPRYLFATSSMHCLYAMTDQYVLITIVAMGARRSWQCDAVQKLGYWVRDESPLQVLWFLTVPAVLHVVSCSACSGMS